MLLCALSLTHGGSKEVVIIGRPENPDTEALINAANKGYHPEAVTLFIPEGEGGKLIRSLASYTEGFTMLEGKAAAYVCSNFQCRLPTTEPFQLEEYLRGAAG